MTLEESRDILAKKGLVITLEHQYDNYNDKIKSRHGEDCSYEKRDIYSIGSWIDEGKITPCYKITPYVHDNDNREQLEEFFDLTIKHITLLKEYYNNDGNKVT